MISPSGPYQVPFLQRLSLSHHTHESSSVQLLQPRRAPQIVLLACAARLFMSRASRLGMTAARITTSPSSVATKMGVGEKSLRGLLICLNGKGE
jgi:hypothetical protein